MNEVASPRPARDESGNHSLIKAVSAWLRDLLHSRNGESSVREALEEIIEERGETEVPIDAHERLLLGNILRLRDATAYTVMVPRADIVAVEITTSLDTVTDMMARQGHSRMPVYRNTLDDVVGMVHIKDVLAAISSGKNGPLRSLLRRILFVSPSIRVMDLLLEMRLKRTHMALVVDEYGGIDGLVTVEDLVEEIVGDIEDEHDTGVEPEFILHDDGSADADARYPIKDLEERVGPVLSDDEREDADTLGGLVSYLAGR
ncbi:MAG: HlyC/CorC family transporter, partial [Alphaproteobacteria bacterium]|nr:HlyC/CorC family transporter [Alphaproteobacteria bacterium]